MDYYFDTEFLEGTQDKRFLGINTRIKTKPTIDLISIGIVAEDGREYYAISKDFNLKEAWKRYQINKVGEDHSGTIVEKEYWIRDNVLKGLFSNSYFNHYNNIETFREFRNLINHFGKSNNQIAEEVKEFCRGSYWFEKGRKVKDLGDNRWTYEPKETNFYAYYADYDWVVFCWLFGSMIDLPKGFPMYCKDLKQELDNATERLSTGKGVPFINLKEHEKYPKNNNEHNALADARWNKELHQFIKSLS